MPSKKKKYNARFPAGRIKKIMQTDEEVGKVAQAVPIIISRTLELFVESLLTKSLEVTTKRNAKTLSPSHVKQCILSESRFDFLKDLVKNIPDMSHAEERELNQNWSTDNSPNANRFQENASNVSINPGPSNLNRRAKQPHRKDNGQSSDSGSDHELPAKLAARGVFGNGRNLSRPSTNFDEELRAYVRDTQSKKAAIPPQSNSFAVPTTISVPTTRENNNNSSQQRIFNFYAETLPDEDEDKEKDKNMQVVNHSSVIQPNPEYCGTKTGNAFGYYKSSTETSNQVPYAKISVMSPSVQNVHNESLVPKLHIDLSKGFPLQTLTRVQNEPFTPTLLLQPQTPTLSEGHCSKYLTHLSRKGSDEIPVGSIHRNDGGSSLAGPSGKRNCSNEPPLLLPISLVHKGAQSSSSKRDTAIELDEDYDT